MHGPAPQFAETVCGPALSKFASSLVLHIDSLHFTLVVYDIRRELFASVNVDYAQTVVGLPLWER